MTNELSSAQRRYQRVSCLICFLFLLSFWNVLGVEFAVRAVTANVPHLDVIFKESQR